MDMHRVSTGICKKTARCTEKRQNLPTRLWITGLVFGPIWRRGVREGRVVH